MTKKHQPPVTQIDWRTFCEVLEEHVKAGRLNPNVQWTLNTIRAAISASMIEPPALPTEQLKPALPMLPQPGDSFTIVSRGTVWVYGEAPHPLIGKTPNQLHKTWVRRDRDPLYKYLIGGIERFAVPGDRKSVV